jgi:hypothetical protein
MDLQYKEPLNSNLICSICHHPFEDPITISCQHTFCLSCLQQHLDKSQVCPLDRTIIDLNWTQSKIVSLLVDELIVYCLNKSSGCVWEGERQHLKSHLESCSFQLKKCKWNCGYIGLDIEIHQETCSKAEEFCSVCEEMVPVIDKEHAEECNPEKQECPLCGHQVLVKRLEDHDQICPQSSVSCSLSRFGCPWSGKRIDVESHASTCQFVSLEPFFKLYQHQHEQLVEENSLLKARVAELEACFFELNGKIMETMAPMYPPILLDNMVHDIRMVRTDMEQLGMSIAQNDLKRDQQNNMDQARTRDEIQSLRTLCHTLQMQVFNLAVRNTPTTTTPSTSKKGNTKL